MCGINGILSWGKAEKYLNQIQVMNDVLQHRGPDDEGVYTDNDILLGHRRLSIIDLSVNGKQPMSNYEKTVWVVQNGEIYNFRDLKKILEDSGHQFKSVSDTEVIIHGYEQWGTKLFEKLDGMFAFGLWDKIKKKLFLVRDGCGIKPLFYFLDDKNLVFSSEIKGLLASGLVDRKINPQSLSNFLSLFYVPGTESIIEKVKQVSAGSFIEFKEDNIPEHKRHWELYNGKQQEISKRKDGQIFEQIRNEISISVDKSLISDVPVSLLLSSGLDSSIILNELKNIERSDIETITIGFKDKSYDESKIAKRFSSDFGFKNNSFIMPGFIETEVLEKLVYHLDSLNANPCILAEYYYFQRAAEKFKVTLMGSGNDELFAGYPTYIADQYRKYYGVLPLFIRKQAFLFAQKLPVKDKKYSFDYFAQKFTEGSLFHKEKSHYWWRTIFSDEEKRAILRKDLVGENNIKIDSYYTYDKYFEKMDRKLSFEEQSLYSDFYLFLIDNANMEVDQLSMAFSLEARPPFLTKRFVEFAFSIPYDLKLRGRETKYCLKRAYGNILPDYILNRKKHGLVSPLGHLFKDGMKDFVYGYLLSGAMSEYFNRGYIEYLLKRQIKGQQNNTFKLFSLLCFAIWQKHFITGKHQN